MLLDVLGMTGTKFGCGIALSSNCTVHVHGVASRSCITPIDSTGISAITTIEAIGGTRELIQTMQRRARMLNIRWLTGVAFAVAIATAMPAAAQSGGETITPHFEHVIPNIPGKSLVALVVDYAPGGASPPHTHAKSAFAFAYVVSGAIESQVNDEPKRVYRAAESFYETPGSRHPVSRNASKTEPARLLAVFIVDTDDKALTTPVK